MANIEFHAGDFVSYVYNGCRFVSIIMGKNDIGYDELVCLVYDDPKEEEEGFLYYSVAFSLEDVTELRMATDEEKNKLLEELEYDGNFYVKECNEIVSCDTTGQEPFVIKRSVTIQKVYEDTIRVFAPDMETALKWAETKNANKCDIAEHLSSKPMDFSGNDISKVELSCDMKRTITF